MQNTSWEMLEWKKHKLESDLQGELSMTTCTDETTLMAESEEELKSLLMKVERGEWKSWLKTQHSKNEDHGFRSHHFMANRWEAMETVTDFVFLCSKITADNDCSHELKRHLLLERKAMTNLDSCHKAETTLWTEVRIVKTSFSSSHVWMWELDHKECWALNNWFFWTVMLEKTLESRLDCKEIKPGNPKENQP